MFGGGRMLIMPAMPAHDLPAWTLVSLRPQGDHTALRRAAARQGGRLLALSPWRIVPTDDDATRHALDTALRAGRVVFTSPAAVRSATRLSPLHLRAGSCWLAVGGGTATALHRAGIADVRVPARADSEGLLDLPELGGPAASSTALAGIAVGLVTAPGGRDHLVPALVARGAAVRRADVYRREPVAFSPSAIDRLLAAEGPLVLAVSSGQALQHAIERLPADALTRLRAGRAVAASARLAALTHRCGFADVAVAPGPRPAQLLSVLADGGGTAR